MKNGIGYFAMLIMILLTLYSQVIMKWRVGMRVHDGGGEIKDKMTFVIKNYTDPWILSALVCGLLANICWTFVISKLPVSYAFPVFIGLSFVTVISFNIMLFNEKITWNMAFGILMIIGGIYLASQNR